MSDYDRLVEQAREEAASSPLGRFPLWRELMAGLADAVEQLQRERVGSDELIATWQNIAAYERAEVVRLADGIREIAGMHDGHDSECVRCQARALLDAALEPSR